MIWGLGVRAWGLGFGVLGFQGLGCGAYLEGQEDFASGLEGIVGFTPSRVYSPTKTFAMLAAQGKAYP